MTGGKAMMNETLKLRGKLQLLLLLEDGQRLANSTIRPSIPHEQLEKLENNELFATATEEGLSKETVRKITEPALDYFLEKINWEKIKASKTVQLIKIFCDEIDFDAVNGAFWFDFADSYGVVDGVCSPEFKKRYIFS